MRNIVPMKDLDNSYTCAKKLSMHAFSVRPHRHSSQLGSHLRPLVDPRHGVRN